MSKFSYTKRGFPVMPPSVEERIAEENREKREEQRSEKEIEEGKQGQKIYDDELAAQKEVNAEKQEMSDRLKPPGAHSMIYEKRPELYGGTVPEYKNVEPAPATPVEEPEGETDLDVIDINEIADTVRGMESVELDAAIESELAERSVAESSRNRQIERVHAALQDMED